MPKYADPFLEKVPYEFIYLSVLIESMLAVHTPAPFEPNKPIRNGDVEELAANHCYEIVREPAYLPDRVVLERIRASKDPNVILYIALMRGITPIMTIGQYKSFVASFDMEKKQKDKRKIPNYKI